MTLYSPVGIRRPSMDLIALRAASAAASPEKSRSWLLIDQPLPLLSWFSIIAVAKDVIRVFCSV